MIRRPPSVIPLRQSDVEDVQKFLAQKVAEAKEQRIDDSMTENSAAEANGQQQHGGSSSVTAANAKGKGKAQSQDELFQQEEQSRQTRSQASRDQRIGL